MIKVKIADVVFDEYTQMGIMLLEDDTSKVIPIWIGIYEAQAILFKMQNMFFPRPLTHDLFKNCLDLLKVKIREVVITTVKDNTFYAEIKLVVDDKHEIILDSRPSDAVALAVRFEAPIYISEEIMKNSSMTKEEFAKEQKDKFYKHLLEITPLEEENKLKH